MSRKILDDPNFTIVLPGPCNARCKFCFWKEVQICDNYLVKLDRVLRTLNNKITQISISGGEPTLSPVFVDVLKLLKEYNFPKIVLTTNGANVFNTLPAIIETVHHVNISRHHYNDELNEAIFGVSMPDTDDIFKMRDSLEKAGIDTNINYVYTEGSPLASFVDMILFTKTVGAHSLTIRNDYNIKDSFKMNPFEDSIKTYNVISEGSCPVCVTRIRRYQGLEIRFKYSKKDPSKVVKDIYEFVFQPDGILYTDWDRKQPMIDPVKKSTTPKTTYNMGCGAVINSCGISLNRTSSCGSSGCGTRTLSC